jgi:hypothetical protein
MGSTRFLIIAAAVVLALGCYAPLSLTQGHTTSTKQSDEADRGENAACAMDASVKRSFSEANVPSATNSSTNFSYTCSMLLIVCISELLIVRIRGCSKLQSRNRLMPGDSGLFAEVFDWAFR